MLKIDNDKAVIATSSGTTALHAMLWAIQRQDGSQRVGLTKLNYIQFLRDVGSHFTINKMLSFDSVKLRLDREQSLSYMEFNYMILQA